jgi:hypothetical protein
LQEAHANGIAIDNIYYTLDSGVISTIKGARVWVAKNNRPTSSSPTVGYFSLIELNGKIFYGMFRKAGARLNSIDGIDKTIVNDYNIRLNYNAAQSIKQSVKF